MREAEVHEESVQGHSRIVDLIEAGDGAGAAQAMRTIITHGLDRLERANAPRKRKIAK